MSSVSSSQDDCISESDKTDNLLRPGQLELVEYIRENQSTKIVPVKWPGGYGKTQGIASAYREKRKINQCNRLLLVVANETQMDQIMTDFETECQGRRVGMMIPGGVYKCDSEHNAVAASTRSLAEVFVVTIQRISACHRASRSKPEKNIILNLIKTGGLNWMLGPDEYHHYATQNDWGESLTPLVEACKFVLPMSATPDRDGFPTIFGVPVLSKTYVDAYLEHCVKYLHLRWFNYLVVLQKRDGSSIEVTTEELAKQAVGEGCQDIDVFMSKKDLRYHPGYVDPLITETICQLVENKANTADRAQSLFRAFSCNHAKYLCSQISSLGYKISCDWIGTKSEHGGRTDETNKGVKTRFCPPKDSAGFRPKSDLDVLVQVGMAGEGFDCVDVMQVTDLDIVTLDGNSNKSKQFYLRGSRWMPGIRDDHQRCDINVSTDHPLALIENQDIMKWIDTASGFSKPSNTPPPPPPPEPTYIDIEWYKENSVIQDVRLLDIGQNDPRAKDLFEQIRFTSDPIDREFWTSDNPEAMKRVRDMLAKAYQQMNQSRMKESEIAKEDRISVQIDNISKMVAGLVLSRYGGTFQEHIKEINKLIAQAAGGWRAKDCRPTSDQLSKAADFIGRFHNSILQGVRPTWVQ